MQTFGRRTAPTVAFDESFSKFLVKIRQRPPEDFVRELHSSTCHKEPASELCEGFPADFLSPPTAISTAGYLLR